MVTTLEVSLRRVRDAESYRQTMEMCLSDARLLRTLVDALMRQARSELGVFRELPVPTDVSALLHESIAILGTLALQRGIALTQSIDESMQADVPPVQLKQAVMGLLENAIDHNRVEGSVELSASVDHEQLRIEIRDTGPGIAAEHLPRIFEPFYRVSQSRDLSGHLGLGLYLVKTHIDAMNGKCLVSSEPGKGTVFKILLPASKTVEKPLAPMMAG